MDLIKNIRVVDGTEDGWEEEVRSVTKTWRNFVVILPPGQEIRIKLCNVLGCPPDGPDHLGKWGVHAMHDVLEHEDYKQLLQRETNGDCVYFVEQLRLPSNQPPKIKNFIVYCEARGIFSEHSSLEDARKALYLLIEMFRRIKIMPMAGIYFWEGDQWSRFRGAF